MTHTPTPAAIACSLSGAYLIEASAGTGKTWTLTGIILRLLIEKNIAPERIIATTFTRAAAAEMQERVYHRLVEFEDCCHWLQLILVEHNLYQVEEEVRVQAFEQGADTLPALNDPINQYLLNFLLNEHPKTLEVIIRRVQLLLSTLNKLFVGTLDSLAQKWLKEFGDDIGIKGERTLLMDDSPLIRRIVHDALRQEHARLYTHQPLLYELIGAKIFAKVEEMVAMTANAMHFYGAPIDEVATIDDTQLQAMQASLMNVLAEDFLALEPYYDEAFCRAQGMNARKAITTLLGLLPNMVAQLHQQGLSYFSKLSKEEDKLLGGFTKDNIYNIFNKGKDAGLARWQEVSKPLLVLGEIYQGCVQVVASYWYALIAQIAQKIRHEGKRLLEESKETTFALQMANLTQALAGRQGEKLAKHIRHLYPVALIDEVQDINGEQAKLIERLYLRGFSKTEEDNKWFLLLVGDPKQAIYRFRGGDVANYTRLKHKGMDTSLTLDINRRSSRRLIEALNQWFCADEEALSCLGDEIFYHPVSASKGDAHWQYQTSGADISAVPTQPICVLAVQNQSDHQPIDVLAAHINTLLQSGVMLGDRALLPSDIAVLTFSNDKLYQVQAALGAFGIDGVISKNESVFHSEACHALYALIQAMINPSDANLGRMLTLLFRLTLESSQELLTEETQKSILLIYLKRLDRQWQRAGVGAALEMALAQMPQIAQMGDDKLSVWQYLSEFDDAKRHLTDMWQLISLLAMQEGSTHQIATFLMEQMTKSAVEESQERLTLPSDSSVQLLTVHKSKGLEFAVVYVVGLEGELKKDTSYKLYPYSDTQGERRLSATPHRHNTDEYYQTLDQKEDVNERRRLAYVALTRASEQLIIIAKESSRNTESLLKQWGVLENKQLTIPERMKGYMQILPYDELVQTNSLIKQSYQYQHASVQNIEHLPWQRVYPKVRFEGVYRTSFTALSYYFDWATQTRARIEPSPDIPDYDATEETTTALGQAQDIRASFVKGAAAGTFLHKVLEMMNAKDGAHVSQTIIQQAKALAMPVELTDEKSMAHMQLRAWLIEVASRPFLASGVALSALGKAQRQSEMSFMLGLGEHFELSALHKIFSQYSDKPLPKFFDVDRFFGYLSGEIDLVYCAQGKYYVVDYKSNFLGEAPTHYHQAALEEAMNTHGYWLQATVYQLALHRLLKLRIKDYQGNETSYLGAVEYVFLRGVSQADDSSGRLVWQPPMALIWALDRFFS